jgi:hypothetical protein
LFAGTSGHSDELPPDRRVFEQSAHSILYPLEESIYKQVAGNLELVTGMQIMLQMIINWLQELL